jgi:hypothetical protein
MPLESLPVTVVVPAYRRPGMVERAIRSVQAQQRQPSELIVVDDASGDDTGARAEALGAKVITHEQNRGEGEARNTGIEAAENEWVALLDSDDEWLPAHLATLWDARASHALVGSAMLGVGPEVRSYRVYGWSGRQPLELTHPEDVAVPENKLPPSAVLIRRDAVLEAGGFRNLPRAADLDMWLRVLERHSALAIPRVTGLYHLHAGQASIQPKLMQEAHQAVLDASANRGWCTAKIRRQHEGVVAWDTARADLADGGPTAAPLLHLVRQLADPWRAVGVIELLAGRFRGRRLATRAMRNLGIDPIAAAHGR